MTRRILFRPVLPAALCLLLAGCASLLPFQPPAAPAPAAANRAHDSLELTGRLSVRYQSGDKEEALHGSFTWTARGDDTAVTLLSPLGQTIAIIRLSPGGAVMEQAGQQPRSAADVDALTAETLGWPLPVSGLRDWLQGFAIDSGGHPFVASPEATEVQTRDGWRISYPAWTAEQTSPPRNRPRRIDLSRHTVQAGDVSLRIVIDSWQAR